MELDLVVELEGVQEIVECDEVCFLEMVSNDGNGATVNITTTQQSTVGSVMNQVPDTVLLRRRAVAERVIYRNGQRVTDSVHTRRIHPARSRAIARENRAMTLQNFDTNFRTASCVSLDMWHR